MAVIVNAGRVGSQDTSEKISLKQALYGYGRQLGRRCSVSSPKYPQPPPPTVAGQLAVAGLAPREQASAAAQITARQGRIAIACGIARMTRGRGQEPECRCVRTRATTAR